MIPTYLRAACVLLLSAFTLAQNSTVNGTTYNTTITWYGTNDQNGSPNCNSNTVACGFYTYVSEERPLPPPNPSSACLQRRAPGSLVWYLGSKQANMGNPTNLPSPVLQPPYLKTSLAPVPAKGPVRRAGPATA